MLSAKHCGRLVSFPSVVVGINQNDLHRHSGKMPLQSFDIIDKLLTIGNAAGHLMVKCMAWDNLDPDIALVLIEKVLKLGKIVKHKGILTELYFDQ